MKNGAFLKWLPHIVFIHEERLIIALSTYYVDVWITEMAGQLLLFISEPDMHKLINLRKGYAIYF